MTYKQIISFLKQNNIEFIENVSFKKFCTYGVGGKIKLMVLPFDINELTKFLEFLGDTNFFMLGNGSKILPSDKTFKTIVIKLTGEFEGFKLCDNELTAYSSVTTAKLLNFCKVNGLSGLEFLQGIPATVGGAVYMNAGANGGEIKNVVKSVDAIVFENNKPVLKTFSAFSCEFDYRHSVFQNKKCVIVSAKFNVEKTEPSIVVKNCENAFINRQNQPAGRSCGSVFKKCGEISAGKLIDDCGLKGLKCGKAVISSRHANFFINMGGAKSKHIKKLIIKAKSEVLKKQQISLIPEVIVLEEKYEQRGEIG